MSDSDSTSAESVDAKKIHGDSDDAVDTESSEEELDLTKECHPIGHYIDDRPEMISQMFSVIKGNKLKAMLPPILKDMDIEQLKLQCLDQLLGISDKRINCILDGELLTESSESEVESVVSESDHGSQDDKSSHSSRSHRSYRSNKKKGKKRKSDTESVDNVSKISKKETEKPPEQGKTLLEILELEMRARAIRALLKQNGEVETQPDQPSITGVVDLTEDDDFPTVIKKEPQTEQEQTFEDKVEKSKTVLKDNTEEVKKQKIIAEQELRNKLIKKKTYRTRKQRLENVEEEVKVINEAPAVVKEEPAEGPTEIIIEDPEDGEVSTDEETEEPSPVVKQEKPETPPPVDDSEKAIEGERIEAIADGLFITNENLEYPEKDDDSRSIEELTIEVEGQNITPIELEESTNAPIELEERSQEPNFDQNISQDGSETSKAEELQDTSWRDRWLQNKQVQKVVKSSKICGKVKKRIASKKAAAQSQEAAPPEITNSDSNSTPMNIVEGSVGEYRLLKGDEQSISEPERQEKNMEPCQPGEQENILVDGGVCKSNEDNLNLGEGIDKNTAVS